MLALVSPHASGRVLCLLTTLSALGLGCGSETAIGSGSYLCKTNDDCEWGWICKGQGDGMGRCITPPRPDSGPPDCPGDPPACAKQDGVCAEATRSCSPEGEWLACGAGDYQAHARAAGLNYQSRETLCDAQDNDCDGLTDGPSADCCEPHCAGRACGEDDGCGNPCLSGSCGPNASCSVDGCVCDHLACATACCESEQVCAEESCCTPKCEDLACGLDPACNALCGVCHDGTYCAPAGNCVANWAVAIAPEAESFGSAVAVDAQQNTYLVGRFYGSPTFGTLSLTATGRFGYSDAFVAKLDPTGRVLWVTQLGGDLTEALLGLAVDAQGNSYVVGHCEAGVEQPPTFGANTLQIAGERDIVVAKLDPAGRVIWATTAGGVGRAEGINIAVDAKGHVHVTGATRETAMFGDTRVEPEGAAAMVVAELDPSGRFVQAIHSGGSGVMVGNGIAVDAAGNRYVAAAYAGEIDVGGSRLHGKGVSGGVLCKFGPDGKLSWLLHLDGPGNDRGSDVTPDGAGGVLFAGKYQGNIELGGHSLTGHDVQDTFVARISVAGEVTWVTTVAGEGKNGIRGIAVDRRGGVLLAGYFESTATVGDTTQIESNAGSDAFVAKLDRAGRVLWALGRGGPYGDSAARVAVDPAGNAYSAGWFQSNIELDASKLEGTGHTTAYVWALGQR